MIKKHHLRSVLYALFKRILLIRLGNVFSYFHDIREEAEDLQKIGKKTDPRLVNGWEKIRIGTETNTLTQIQTPNLAAIHICIYEKVPSVLCSLWKTSIYKICSGVKLHPFQTSTKIINMHAMLS